MLKKMEIAEAEMVVGGVKWPTKIPSPGGELCKEVPVRLKIPCVIFFDFVVPAVVTSGKPTPPDANADRMRRENGIYPGGQQLLVPKPPGTAY
ncbi:hypothetical protein [Deinococcus sp.]|uniref:hypothetical protein n=1 Tax=Deinococcus sp. TaxID=47478 RepID=UPI0025CE89E5|nr:hypothetical protein [Deinococcus sp.]